MYGYGYGSFSYISSGVAADPDAQAFITAASITDPTQQSAVNQLVLDLKSASIWTKMKAVYPFVGGSAASHKWNLKDPRDLDAAFRLTFSGGWTHSSTGSLPNSTNTFANTHFTPLANQLLTSAHFSFYSRTADASTSDFGSSGVRDQITALSSVVCARRKGDNLRYVVMFSEGTGGVVVPSAETDARGLYLGSRTANNSLKFFKNTTLLGSNTDTNSTTLSSNSYFLGCINENGSPLAASYDNKELAFSSLGDGLTDQNVTDLYTAVQTFQTTLSRNV